MENRAATMAKSEFDFGFAVDWMRKDLAIVLDEARSNGAHLPVTAAVDQFYGQVQRPWWQPLGYLFPHRSSRPQINAESMKGGFMPPGCI